jgi:hypothetical protein
MRETDKFKADLLKLFQQYDIAKGHFMEVCTNCGSISTGVHFWNPAHFSRVCLECGFHDVFNIEYAPPDFIPEGIQKI